MPRNITRAFSVLKPLLVLIAFVACGNLHEARAQVPAPEPGEIVFSQIYTRGGNSGSIYKNNFIELFNRTEHAIDISGHPFYLTSDTGTLNVAIAFSSSRGHVIQPGGYLLIEFETTGTSGGPLPPSDLFVPQLSQSASLSPSGRIALTKPGTNLDGPCPVNNPGVIDFVGYGTTANCFEGSGPTATLSETTAAIRKSRGCTDSNNNTNDFFVSAPNPRNTQWPKTPCSGNAIDEPDFFVRQHYSDFLNRQPDPSGLVFWSNQIVSCDNNQACIEVRRINGSAAFFLSIEFQETGYLVYKMYKAAYGNIPGAPVPITYGEFLPDSQQIALGVQVGIGNWQETLEANKVAFSNDFVNRVRFSSMYASGLTPAQFVDALIAHAGFTPTAAERQAFIDVFGTAPNTANTQARARVVRLIAENGTFHEQEKNRAFVLAEYFGYLRRNPYDPPELTLDFQGYNFWLTKLNQFNGDFVAAEMVKAFITSTEYRQRF